MNTFSSFLKEQQLLLEEYDYKQLFTKYISLLDSDKQKHISDSIDYTIQTTIANLKKNFRVIWFLQLELLYRIATNLSWYPENTEMQKLYDKKCADFGKKVNMSAEEIKEYIKRSNFEGRSGRVLSNYKHYLDLNIQSITDYNPSNKLPNQVMDTFKEIEDAWAKEQEGTIPYSKQPIYEGNKDGEHPQDYDEKDYVTVICDLGNGWYWVDLDKDSCDLESKAMGHCGNSGNSGSTLLSLRYLKKKGTSESTWVWEVHLTFELEEDHMLGQMKGKQNNKPASKYHHFILELLKAKHVVSSNGDSTFVVKGIRGGGYRPETNFSLNDLTPEQQEQAIKDNPNLDILHLIMEAFGEKRVTVSDYNNITISGFALANKGSELSLLDLYDDSSRDAVDEDLVEQICNEGYFDNNYYNDSRTGFSDIISYMNVRDEYVTKCIEFLDSQYPDWKEENEDWDDYVRENGVSEIEEIFERAYSYAEEASYADEVLKDFEKAVDSSPYIIFNNWDSFSLVFHKIKNLDLLQRLADTGNPNDDDHYSDKEVCWTWSEPHYGWSPDVSYDEFNSHLGDMINELDI